MSNFKTRNFFSVLLINESVWRENPCNEKRKIKIIKKLLNFMCKFLFMRILIYCN